MTGDEEFYGPGPERERLPRADDVEACDLGVEGGELQRFPDRVAQLLGDVLQLLGGGQEAGGAFPGPLGGVPVRQCRIADLVGQFGAAARERVQFFAGQRVGASQPRDVALGSGEGGQAPPFGCCSSSWSVPVSAGQCLVRGRSASPPMLVTSTSST